MQRLLDIPGGRVSLFDNPLSHYDLEDLYQRLFSETQWEQRHLSIRGMTIPEPRLTAWYSEYTYMYSGIKWDPKPMTSLLKDLSEIMGYLSGETFNGVLLNYYKDGKSSIGMHSDDEPEFGKNPTIASLSLGAERWVDFQIKDKSLPIVRFLLKNGSVLVMGGRTQDLWKHGIAKTKDEVGPRINLTFRNIVYQG